MDVYKAETNQIGYETSESHLEINHPISFYLNNIIEGINLSESFNCLLELINLPRFNIEDIEIKSEYFDKISFIINALFQFPICILPNSKPNVYSDEGDIEIDSVCKKSEYVTILHYSINTIKLMWKNINQISEILINEGIIQGLISLLIYLHQSSTISYNSDQSNLLYITQTQYNHFFSDILTTLSFLLHNHPDILFIQFNPLFFQCLHDVIIPLIPKSTYSLDSLSSRKFISCLCENDQVLSILHESPDFFNILVPQLVESLSLTKISEQSLSLCHLIRYYGHPIIALALESNLINQIHHIYSSYYDQTEDYPILFVLSILLRFSLNPKDNPDEFEQVILMRKDEIITECLNPNFLRFIHIVVAGHISEPAPYLYEFVQTNMDILWREFFNEGLILHMINYFSQSKSFANKIEDFKCILLFLEIVTRELDDIIRHQQKSVQEIYDNENIDFILSQKTVNSDCFPFSDSENEEEFCENEEAVDLSSLSLFGIQASAIRDGAIEIIIDNFLTTKDWQIVKRSSSLILHLIQGPKEYAEIIYSHDIIDALESVQAELDNSELEEDEYQELSQIISTILQLNDEKSS